MWESLNKVRSRLFGGTEAKSTHDSVDKSVSHL